MRIIYLEHDIMKIIFYLLSKDQINKTRISKPIRREAFSKKIFITKNIYFMIKSVATRKKSFCKKKTIELYDLVREKGNRLVFFCRFYF